MAIKEWSTNYSGANPTQDADPITGDMPDLVDLTDDTRSSQVEAPRDKLQAVCKMAGDSANAPAGSIADIIDRDHANGDARQLRLRERATAPSTLTDRATIYAIDEGGVTKVKARLSDGSDVVMVGGETARGVRISISDDQPVADIPLGTGDTKIMPETGASIAFEAPVAGKYDIRFAVNLFANANTTCQFKIVFDEGTGDEQSIGYGDQWQVRQSSAGDYIMPCFFGEVTLSAGSHTAKAYGKDISGDGQILGSGTVAAGCPTLVLVLVSGSGAGGTLVDKYTLAADSDNITTLEPSWQTVQVSAADIAIADVGVAQDEVLLVTYTGTAFKNSTTQVIRALNVTYDDGSGETYITSDRCSRTYQDFDSDAGFAIPTPPLPAGTYTFRLKGHRSTHVSDWALKSGGIFAIHRFRGGISTLDSRLRPKGTWQTATTVNFAAQPLLSSTVRRTLQDGVQRYFSGTLNWAVANGVADLGYDEAGSQGNSKWLHWYLVPSSGDDSVLTVRASDNPPSTGPAGYTNFQWVWASYIDGSGNIREILQVGEDWFYSRPLDDANLLLLGLTTSSGGAWVNISTQLALAVPVDVAEAVLVRGWIDSDSGDVFRLFVEPGNPPALTPTDTWWARAACIASSQESQSTASRVIEIPDNTLSYYLQVAGGGGDIDAAAMASGFRVP